MESRKMRNVTEQEAEEWMALAQQHGFASKEGFALGRFIVEPTEVPKEISLLVITPIPADLYTENLQTKTPPIEFDRTAEGQIILPGRWWQHMFERTSEDPEIPEDVRRNAQRMSRHSFVPDTFLPVATETISILAPDASGKLVPTEVVPPGGRISFMLERQEEA